MEKNIKEKTFFNLIWRFAERILAQSVTLLVTIVLARILMPDDYAAVALISVFVNICNIFVTKSFGNALIQKKDADDLDFSTIFYINLAMTMVMYVVIFVASPWIADFYEMPILCPLLRVMALRIPCAAVNSVQNAYVSRQLKFKKYFFATLTGTVVSAVVGISMALLGFGAWALVFQYLTNVLIDTVFLWFTVKWRPKLMFSLRRARSMFSYGGKLLASSLLEEASIEIKSAVIGKVYTSADLAYYTKGKQFPQIINVNINESIRGVLFPVLAKAQDNVRLLKNYMARVIKISSFVIFPLQFGLIAVAPQFVSVILTDKWLGCVPYLRIMCLSFLLTPIFTANQQVMKAMGKSGWVLTISFIRSVADIAMVLLTLPFGVEAIVWGSVAISFIITLFSAILVGKWIDYGFMAQIKDLLPTTLLSAAMTALVMLVGMLPINNMFLLILQVAIGVLFYILVAHITKIDSYFYILSFVKEKLKRKKDNGSK